MYKTYFILVLSFLFLATNAQENDNHQQIIKSVNDYYSLTSENIHLHFNKSVYLTNETIWFKGYIIDKKSNGLNYETTNVYVRILDKDKKEVDNKLFLANSGTIIGHIKLQETYASGNYYIHTYTNYMNNFEEDESSIFPIEIINTKDKPINNSVVDNESINFSIEGEKLLFECDNTVAVQIKNCNANGVKLKNIKVFDSQNNIITQFSTNEQGFGRFDILKTNNEIYKIVIEKNGGNIEKKLPIVTTEGISISVNNYSDDKQLFVKIKTNTYTLNKIKDEKFTLSIQKNNQVNLIDFYFKNLSTDIILDKTALFKGINTLRILDKNNNSVAERLIYNHVENLSKIVLEKNGITKDTLHIKAHLKDRIANFSISVLPIETISSFEKNTITSSLNFNNYLLQTLENYSYYFKDFNRKKQYELDLVLLNQESSKYNWNTILTKKPTIKYPFDSGVTIEGTLNQVLKNKDKYTLNLFSIENGINLTHKIEDNYTFAFKDIIAIDSTTFFISLLKDTKYENLKLYSKISNHKNRFLKTFYQIEAKCENKTFVSLAEYNSDFPYQKNIIKLKEVELSETKKEKFIYKNEFGNNSSQKYKITEDDLSLYTDVLSFIQLHGYQVSNNAGNVQITNRYITSLRGSNSPTVILDGISLSELYPLYNLNLRDVDEIYINRFGFGQGMNGSGGVIKIYTKKTYSLSEQNNKSLSKLFIISDGFQKEIPFTNPIYLYPENQAFKNYGTIHWIPNLYTDENGDFEFKIPTLSQDKLLLNIQGIDNAGNLYDENIVIDVN